MALIAIEGLEVRYGRNKALDNVTCHIEGGTVGLLGPNGAGKSTLLKTLLGFVKPKKGSVTVFGRPMPKEFIEVRQRLGYMPEKEVISPKISAVNFLTYCGRLYGMARVDAMERSHELLNYVGMDDNRYRHTETYSTGMLQRMKFATALIHDPKILLLDEPTNGLDPDGRATMLELIRDLPRDRDITVLISSHLLPDVEYVCDRVIMISKGRIVRDGTKGEITAVREGLFEVRVRDNKAAFIEALARGGMTVTQQPNGNLLLEKPPEVDTAAVYQAARDQHTHIRHMRPMRRSLEEAFMNAVGKGVEE
jgi:ABC-2 type transport system ATP-binding protein